MKDPPATPRERRAGLPSGESSLPTISLPQLWGIVAVALTVIVALQMDPGAVDAAYQIRAGDIILDGLQFVRTNVFSFTAAGSEWVNQQWGAAVILAAMHKLGGWQALHVLRALLLGFSFLLLYRTCLHHCRDNRRAAWLTIVAMVVSVPNFALRSQMFGILLFSLVLFLVTLEARHRWALWAVPVVTVFWANLHGSFFLAPVIIGLAALAEFARHRRNAVRMAMVAAISAVAAVINPYGFGVYEYVVSVGSNPAVTRLVSEWAAPDLTAPVGIMFFASALAVVAVLARRTQAVPWPHIVAFAVFFLIGLTAQRNTIWWALGGAVALAPLVARAPGEDEPKGLGNTAIAALLALVIVMFLPWGKTTSEFVNQAPVRLTAWLDDHAAPGDRIFNAQVYGSWLVYALEDNPVFVDTRIEFYPASVWRDYLRISFGRQGWQDTLDGYGVDFIVADREQQRQLLPLVKRDPGWRLEYEDPDGLIFARTG